MDLLEINKRHVSAYHWPSPGLILNKAVRVLHNYCKRALVLGSHRLRVWLDIAYPTGMKYLLGNSSCVTDGLTLPTNSLLHNGDGKP